MGFLCVIGALWYLTCGVLLSAFVSAAGAILPPSLLSPLCTVLGARQGQRAIETGRGARRSKDAEMAAVKLTEVHIVCVYTHARAYYIMKHGGAYYITYSCCTFTCYVCVCVI